MGSEIDHFCLLSVRAVGRSENPWVPVLFGGHNLPPLVEIVLTDLPKSGDAMAPPGTTPLISTQRVVGGLENPPKRLK